jgi:hypothetical protein
MMNEGPATYARVRCRLNADGILDAIRQGDAVGNEVVYVVDPDDPEWERIFALCPLTLWQQGDGYQQGAMAIGVELAIGRERSARIVHLEPEFLDFFDDTTLAWRRPEIEIERGTEPAVLSTYLPVEELLLIEEKAEADFRAEVARVEVRLSELEAEWVAWSIDIGREQGTELIQRLSATDRAKFSHKLQVSVESSIRYLTQSIDSAEASADWAERLNKTLAAQLKVVEEAESEDRKIRQRNDELSAAGHWVADNGSSRLRKATAAGLLGLSMGAYRDERLSFERPGWSWCESTEGLKTVINPTEPQLDALVEARKLDLNARLVWTQGEGRFVLAPFLGRQISLNVESEAAVYGFDEEPF